MNSNTLAFVVKFGLIAFASASASAAETITADRDGFRKTVAPLFAKYCIDCHGPDAAEADLTLHDIDADLLTGDEFENWRLIEERLTFGEMPPQGSDQPNAAERQAILDWIRGELKKTMRPGVVSQEKLLLPQYGNYVDHQALFGERRDRVTPAPPRIWRIRPDIYETLTRRVARGEVKGMANALSLLDGSQFKDYAAPYFLDEASTTQLVGNAEKIAAAQLQRRSYQDLVSDQGPPKLETVKQAIENAFRLSLGRAPTQEEQQRFTEFYNRSKAISDYRVAARALLSAVVLQPEFLFRRELGEGQSDDFGRVRLSQREIAYALSYALANEPLDEFLAAAKNGKLATRDQVAEAVRKRLQDDSIEYDKNPRLKQFFREYFYYPHATEVFKDQPEGGVHEPGMLVGDLELTIREILKADKHVLAELLTTRKYYVNTTWSYSNRGNQVTMRKRGHAWPYHAVYGLPLDWRWSVHLQPVEFPEGDRAGVLTHPAWLAAWSGNFDNHPVQRGKWIRTHLLGGTVPDVPIGVDARVPEAEHKSFRQRLEMTTRKTECWRCHKKMDPLGLPFERYDHYGRYQRVDTGQPVVVTGAVTRTRIPGLDQDVAGPTEMMEMLANSEYVEQVFVRHVFRYFLGRNETLGDANTLQDAHKAYRDSGGSFNALVVSLLSSDSFLYRQLPQRRGD